MGREPRGTREIYHKQETSVGSMGGLRLGLIFRAPGSDERRNFHPTLASLAKERKAHCQ